MKKRMLKFLQVIAWVLGFVALGLLIYGIIKNLFLG
jgi:hypothetical protein